MTGSRAPTTSNPLERRVVRAVGLRIMPLLTVAYFAASLDRVNVGFAALQMNHAIGLSPSVFGFGAGVFFVAYSLFAVPGTLLLQRMGLSRGLGLVMLAWSLTSAATALVQGPWSFYVLRFLLGMAEAAFFPGTILYLGGWLPARARGRLLSILMLGLPLASVLGSPLSAALLSIGDGLGLRGWQWLFLIEALPALAVGLIALRMLPASPALVPWLTADARHWLTEQLRAEHASPHPKVLTRQFSWRLLAAPRVLALAVINIGAIAVTNGLAIWQPQIIRASGLTLLQTGVVNALPFALGCAAMYLWAWHSDHWRERRLHTALPLACGGLALGVTFLHVPLPVALLGFCVAVAAASMVKSPFWALATECLPEEVRATAFGHITSLTNIGAFVGTYAIGATVQLTGGYSAAMVPLMAMMFVAFICALIVGGRTPVTPITGEVS